MASGRNEAMLVAGGGVAARTRPEIDAERANERRRLRAHVRAVILPGLYQLTDSGMPAAELIARADVQSRRLRTELERGAPEGGLVDLDAAIVRAREDEREWVRGHLHDTALQILEFVAGDGFGTGLSATKIAHLAGGAARDLRTWIDSVEEPAVAQLLPELEQVAEEARSLDRTVRLVVGELGVPPTGEQVAAITGAVREAVNNARKHANARQVIVHVQSADDGRTSVTVSDDGIGIDADRVGGGLGLSRSIVARMRRVGGHASLEDAPGGGTRVTLMTSRSDPRP